MSLTVTVIGSCRVLAPFGSLVRQGLVERDQTGVYGFTHCTKEVLQLLRSMHGELTIPVELRPFIASQRAESLDDPKVRLNDLRNTDLLVIELSSAKELAFRGLYLQLVQTQARLRNASRAVTAWWRALERDGTDVEDRQALLAGEDLPAVIAAVVAEVSFTIQGPEEIRSDMRDIRASHDGPIMFVTHFDTPRPDGRPGLTSRGPLIAAVSETARELGCRVYDPSADILAYAAEQGGLTAALPDMGHYTRGFVEERLAERLHDEALAAVGSTRVG